MHVFPAGFSTCWKLSSSSIWECSSPHSHNNREYFHSFFSLPLWWAKKHYLLVLRWYIDVSHVYVRNPKAQRATRSHEGLEQWFNLPAWSPVGIPSLSLFLPGQMLFSLQSCCFFADLPSLLLWEHSRTWLSTFTYPRFQNMAVQAYVSSFQELTEIGTSPVVQRLRLCVPNSGSLGSIPRSGNEILHAATK